MDKWGRGVPRPTRGNWVGLTLRRNDDSTAEAGATVSIASHSGGRWRPTTTRTET